MIHMEKFNFTQANHPRYKIHKLGLLYNIDCHS